MPHKHKRQKHDDGATFDLPPTSLAKALPAFQKPSKHANTPRTKTKPDIKPARSKSKAKLKAPADDTPKSFARLMQFHTLGKRLPKGLDNGTTGPGNKNKKRKLDTADTPTTQEEEALSTTQSQPTPKILPGERLSDFAARVDQALPIIGLRGTDKQRAAKVPGLKERTTKHNKRLERMQKEWRETEKRREAKQQEEMDELDDEREEQGLSMLWNEVEDSGRRRKRKSAEDEDPWKALEKSRAETKQRNLQDVVLAPPPQLNKKVQSRFKEVERGVGVDVENVPGSVGSLRKREELSEVRRKVIEGYRNRAKGRGAEGVRAV